VTLRLGVSDVHVWSGDLDILDAAHRNVLSDDELERATSFRFARDRARFVAARTLLRTLLASYADCHARSIRFAYGPFGKPTLPDFPRLRFNLAHSENCVVVAVTRGREVGVDVELLRDVVDCTLVARHFFAPAEIETLTMQPAGEQPHAFLRCWTRKEAFIKARGDGLSLPLADFEVSFADDAPPALLRTRWSAEEPRAWMLHDLTSRTTVAALAVRDRRCRVVMRKFRTETETKVKGVESDD
jgi:4'-phosphopantetheinyl transferase